MACEGCCAEAQLRRCTRQRLCAACRLRPEFKILRASAVRAATGLPESAFLHLRAGLAGNVVNPRFGRDGVYFWRDVALLCVDLGREVPD